MRRVFEARYYGSCVECGEKIEPGDRVQYSEHDDVVHAAHQPPRERPTTICTTCWLTKPCECDA